MRNEDMRPTPPEMDFTIDDILDEFGSGGSRREPEPPNRSPSPNPNRSPNRSLSRSRPPNRNKSRNKNHNQNLNRNRSLFRSRSIARTTNRPGRTPWTGCAAASGSGRRTRTSPGPFRRRTTRTASCRSGCL